MQPLTPLRTVATVATAALAGVLAVAPEASAAIGTAALTAPPRVMDQGRSLSVPFDAVADQAAGTAMAQQFADSFAGTWLGGVLQYAAAQAATQAASTKPTCRETVTATDSNGATGTATEIVPDQGAAAPLTIANRTPGVRWAAGDVDHFTVKMTCTDARNNSQLSNVTLDQDAVAG